MKLKQVASILILAAALALVGCGEKAKEEFGDSKEDWQKTSPPPDWKGPGQPGVSEKGRINGPPGGP